MKIAVLGARRTGKTALAQALERMATVGTDTSASLLVSEAPTLVTAIDADLRLNDQSRYPAALAQHRRYDLTLLMGLDLDCAPVESLPEPALSRESVDARLRQILTENGLRFCVVYGSGPARLKRALQAIDHLRGATSAERGERDAPWQWVCEKCSDAQCEHRMFTGRLQLGPR
jgi:HTH-type transcriptional repressor of NAD biosynthesis genes